MGGQLLLLTGLIVITACSQSLCVSSLQTISQAALLLHAQFKCVCVFFIMETCCHSLSLCVAVTVVYYIQIYIVLMNLGRCFVYILKEVVET